MKSRKQSDSGRRPLTPHERHLVAVLRTELDKAGISQAAAARSAGIDKGDMSRVYNFGPATPRTLRRLFERFKISEYKKLSAADRREAILHEIRAALERSAELLGKLAELPANGSEL